MNRQPGKALPYYLRLRRPNVFDLIRENNLFTDVRDQVLLLVAFDHELIEKRRLNGEDVKDSDSEAIKLLVNNMHSIPVCSPSIWWNSSWKLTAYRSIVLCNNWKQSLNTYTYTWVHWRSRSCTWFLTTQTFKWVSLVVYVRRFLRSLARCDCVQNMSPRGWLISWELVPSTISKGYVAFFSLPLAMSNRKCKGIQSLRGSRPCPRDGVPVGPNGQQLEGFNNHYRTFSWRWDGKNNVSWTHGISAQL